MSAELWQETIFGIGFGLGVLILGTVILVVVINQFGRVWAARASDARETQYQKLAAQATNYQRRAVAEQEKLVNEVAVLTERLGRIERVLQQVE